MKTVKIIGYYLLLVVGIILGDLCVEVGWWLGSGTLAPFPFRALGAVVVAWGFASWIDNTNYWGHRENE